MSKTKIFKKLKEDIKDIARLVSVSLMTIAFVLLAIIVGFGTYSKLSVEEAVNEVYYNNLVDEFSKDRISVDLANLCNHGFDKLKKIECVHKFYLYFFEYHEGKGRKEKSPSTFMEKGGDCSDFSVNICSTLRNMNISCRVITEFYENGGGHAWSRILVNNRTCRIDMEFQNCYSNTERLV